jgi:hypothetical protein
MRKTYDKALTGKHSNTPPSSPEDRKISRRDNEEDGKPAIIKNSTVEQVCDVIEKKEDQLEVHDSNNVIDNNNYQLTITPACVTPACPEQKTVVTHNQLQQIQRNIFVQRPKEISPWTSNIHNLYQPNTSSFDSTNHMQLEDVIASNKIDEEMKKFQSERMKLVEEKKKVDEENKELVTKVKLLESQLADMKEKYAELKQDIREARQAALVQKQFMDSNNAALLDRRLSDLQAAAVAASNQNNCRIM